VKSVLVTNTGDTAHAAQLAARHDLRVVFVTEPRFVDQYPDGSEFALVDSLNDPAAAVGSVVRQRDLSAFTHVVSLSERAAPVAGYLRSYLGLPGTPFDVVTNCTNKYAMKRALKRAEIRTARFMLAGSAEHVSSAAEQLGWPVIIKPVIGAGVDATFVIDEPNIASREWMRYFLGENRVFDLTPSIAADGSPKYLVVDRRNGSAALARRTTVSSRVFALAPLEAGAKPGS